MSRALIVAMTALATTGFGSSPAAAEQRPALVLAWWTRQPLATAPPGGFQISNAPDGPVALAAFRLPADAVSVRLPVAEETFGEIAAVRLCPATSAWVPVAGGPLTAAPDYDCATSVLARRVGTVWTAELGTLRSAASSVNGIVAVPDGDGLPAPYLLTFLPPVVELAAPMPTPAISTATDPSTPSPSPVPQPSSPPLRFDEVVPPGPQTPRVAAPQSVAASAPAAPPIAAAIESADPRAPLGRRLLLVLVAIGSGLSAASIQAASQRLGLHHHRSRPPAPPLAEGAA